MIPTSNNNNIINESPEAKARKRRLAWACVGVGLLDLILLLLLIFLPNCQGIGRWVGGGNDSNSGHVDTVVRVDTVERVDTLILIPTDTTKVEPVDTAGTDIEEAVEDAGGNVGGFMRFSIKWNQDIDIDAHAKEPTGAEICYRSFKKPSKTRAGGQLDVDKQSAEDSDEGDGTLVENIVWEDAGRLPDGNYRFFIQNYSISTQSRGCDAQLKVGNKTFRYRVGSIGPKDYVTVATVTIRNHQMESINQSRYLVQ